MSGPEVQANAIWTALHGFPLSDGPAAGSTRWRSCAAALAVPLLALRVRTVVAALAAPVDRDRLRRRGPARLRARHRARPGGAARRAGAGLGRDRRRLAPARVASRSTGSRRSTTCSRSRCAPAPRALRATELEIVQRLGQAVESRDDGDRRPHRADRRRCRTGSALAAGLTADEAELLRRASAMHDVGKIAIPDKILRKPGPLTPEERRIMERHAEKGAELLAGSRSDLVQLGEVIARTHHERWDGTGYPAGLAGEDIPLAGRICAICDVFDALVSVAPLQAALDRRRGAGRDPRPERPALRPAARRAVPRALDRSRGRRGGAGAHRGGRLTPRSDGGHLPDFGSECVPIGPLPVRGGAKRVPKGAIGRAPVSEGPSVSRPVSRILS